MDKKLTFFLRNDGRANVQTDGRIEAGVMGGGAVSESKRI